MPHTKKSNSGIWMIVWIVAFVAIAYLVSPQSNWLFTRSSKSSTVSTQQAGGGCGGETSQWCWWGWGWCDGSKTTTSTSSCSAGWGWCGEWGWGWCGGSKTTTTTTPTNNTVDTTITYETVNIGHNEYALVPETVTLTAGKSYKLVITPTADGGWCMNNMTFPGLDNNVYPVKKGVPVTIVINNAKAGTYEVVCGNMGMHQWTIVIQ